MHRGHSFVGPGRIVGFINERAVQDMQAAALGFCEKVRAIQTLNPQADHEIIFVQKGRDQMWIGLFEIQRHPVMASLQPRASQSL